MKPVRLQLSRAKGFRLQEVSKATNGRGAVKVDRASKWGNPYKVAPMPRLGGNMAWRRREERRRLEEAVAKFRALMEQNPRDDLHELRGENLACWCKLPPAGEPDLCHAAVLLELANRDQVPERVPTCHCGDVEDEHGDDPAHPGSTACNVDGCDCVAFEADA